jgi:hypothetical protein
MHIWVVSTREHEDGSVCGFFQSLMKAPGWRRFDLGGDGKEDGIRVSIYWIISTVWAFIPIDFTEAAGIWMR